MVTFLMILFVILCFFLAIAILIQQGKGDMGLGGLGGGGQMLFGGSGGQDFFEKITWIMGAIFILGALGLTILKSRESEKSRISYAATSTQKTERKVPPAVPAQAEETEHK
jgi:preprotein translocase subunit SecG